ncbi:hypothetical protein RJ639_013036 [Escallonia herrerae]|uniref:Uncharacterized protein n=1 Tax=Escallonia herrerae TaxID=1293975 RepID=A0AA88VQU7_9ASTE|nr:hypothetical protein RJ639_013036 [Escallonia herrerae]
MNQQHGLGPPASVTVASLIARSVSLNLVCNMLVSVHYFWKNCGDSRRRDNIGDAGTCCSKSLVRIVWFTAVVINAPCAKSTMSSNIKDSTCP